MKVFVSYTRSDSDWAHQLCAFLRDRGFKPTLDARDVGSAEIWRPRITAALSDSEAVVFVLTDASAEAVECEWEIIEAQRLGKRVIPVLPEPLRGRPPEFLGERSYILFYSDPIAPESGFYAGQKKLEASLRSKRERIQLRPPRPVPPAPPPRDAVMPPFDPAYMPRPQRRRGVPWLRLGLLAGASGLVYVAATNAPLRSGLGSMWAEASSVLLAPEEDDAPDGSEVSAQDYTPERPLFAGASGANVRNYPLPSATILVELPAAAALDITGRLQVQGDWWFRVALADGRVGFIHEDATSSRQPPAPQTVAGMTPIEPPVAVQTGRAGANIRVSPGTRAQRIVRLQAGASVTVTARVQQGGHRWYQVSYGEGRTGWARDDVLTNGQNGPLRV